MAVFGVLNLAGALFIMVMIVVIAVAALWLFLQGMIIGHKVWAKVRPERPNGDA